jgi:hypothetical protein
MYNKCITNPEKSVSSSFLGEFAKLRKATISFVVSVCPSACLHGTNGHPLDGLSQILYLSIFRKSVGKNSS